LIVCRKQIYPNKYFLLKASTTKVNNTYSVR